MTSVDHNAGFTLLTDVELTVGQKTDRPLRRVLFLGIDPDLKGAVCLLEVADCAADSATHGRILSCQFIDLPTRARDAGGFEVDPHKLRALLRKALDGFAGIGGHLAALVERPIVQGRMGRSNTGVVSQAINCGIAFAVVSEALWRFCGGELGPRTVDWIDGGSHGWRRELGLPPAKTTQRRKADSMGAAIRIRNGWLEEALRGEARISFADLIGDKHGRADALLMAEAARRRWLGLRPAAATTRPSAREQTAARNAERRREEAKMIDSRGVTKAIRDAAEAGEECPDCHAPPGHSCVAALRGAGDAAVDVKPHRARVWAHLASLRPVPTLADWATVDAGVKQPERIALRLACSSGVVVRRQGPMSTTGWAVHRAGWVKEKASDRRPRIGEEAHAWLVVHGLLRLTGASGRPEYVPTKRALLLRFEMLETVDGAAIAAGGG